MEHFYQEIEGYFTFPDFYRFIARGFAVGYQPEKPFHAVEMGAYKGQSAAYLLVELDRAFAGYPPGSARLDLVEGFPSNAEALRKNLEGRSGPCLGTIHACDSVEAAATYADRSLDFVFIDGLHDYRSIARDLDAWTPKVRKGGVLAGHDFTLEFPGVIQAVTERFDRWEVWRGRNDGGDAAMQGKYYPCWAVRL
jgi:predicted O-methyltransferase YrrM